MVLNKETAKSIWEMETVELKANKKSNKAEIDELTVEIGNNTVQSVFGLTKDVEMIYNGEKILVTDFMETKAFETIVTDGANNYGVLCSQLFNKKGINNTNLKTVLENIGVSRKIWWQICWKAIKREYLEMKNEKIQKLIEQKSERGGEKMEDSE